MFSEYRQIQDPMIEARLQLLAGALSRDATKIIREILLETRSREETRVEGRTFIRRLLTSYDARLLGMWLVTHPMGPDAGPLVSMRRIAAILLDCLLGTGDLPLWGWPVSRILPAVIRLQHDGVIRIQDPSIDNMLQLERRKQEILRNEKPGPLREQVTREIDLDILRELVIWLTPESVRLLNRMTGVDGDARRRVGVA